MHMFTSYEGMWCRHEGWCMQAIAQAKVLAAVERMLADGDLSAHAPALDLSGAGGGASGLNLVVGSGPSGVAAALALIKRGQEVTLLDGRELEPEPELAAMRRGGGHRPCVALTMLCQSRMGGF
jgi:hypothetical protein